MKILTLDFYVPAAPDTPHQKYEHGGKYCWFCRREQSFFRARGGAGSYACTVCSALESFAEDDMPNAIAAILEAMRATLDSCVPESRLDHAVRLHRLSRMYLHAVTVLLPGTSGGV